MPSMLNFFSRNAILRPRVFALQEGGLLNAIQAHDLYVHFQLLPFLSQWQIFIGRTLATLGSLLFMAGVIFFFAYNWEFMQNMHKFALVQAVLVVFAAFTLWKWHSWLREVGMIAVSLSIGSMLALFGQIYQTGADAWQLFMVWTFLLVPLALLLQKASLWFIIWVTSSLWIVRYIHIEYGAEVFSLDIIFLQLVMWLVCEVVLFVLSRKSPEKEMPRWLPRIIGCFAMLLFSFYVYLGIFTDEFRVLFSVVTPFFLIQLYLPIYMLVLAGMYAYYRRLPDMFFIALGVFGAAGLVSCYLIKGMVTNISFDIGVLFVSGLLITGLCIAALKFILHIRREIYKNIEESQEISAEKKSISLKQELFKELQGYLVEKAALEAGVVQAFFLQEALEDESRTPWYINVFMAIGVWIGVCLIAAYFIVQTQGAFGWLLLAGGIFAARHNSLAIKQAGFCMIMIGLVSVFFNLYEEYNWYFTGRPFLVTMMVVFASLWVLMKSFNSKIGSFALVLVAVLFYFSGYHLNILGNINARFEEVQIPYGFIGSIIIGAVMFFALVSFMGALDKVKHINTSFFNFFVQKYSAELGALLFVAFCAVYAIAVPGMQHYATQGISACMVVFAAYMLVKRYHLTFVLGSLAAGGIAFFQPAVAMGLVLYGLSFYNGSRVFVGTATLYLGASIFWYYYSMDLTLLHKSQVLMGSGAFLLVLAVLIHKLFARANEKGVNGYAS